MGPIFSYASISLIIFDPNTMETAPTPRFNSFNITAPLDEMQGTMQAACSIWWTPARLQVIGEYGKKNVIMLGQKQKKKRRQKNLGQSTFIFCALASSNAMWGIWPVCSIMKSKAT